MDTFIETIMSVIGITVALSGTPQIMKLYQRKMSDDVSLLTWYIIFIGQICWFSYAFYKDSISLILTSGTYTIMSMMVIILVYKFRSGKSESID